MKRRFWIWSDILIASINYILISYALSNMVLLFQHSLWFILFFASEIWVTGNYWTKISGMIKSKLLPAVLLIVCFALHLAMICWVGRVVGTVLPFQQL